MKTVSTLGNWAIFKIENEVYQREKYPVELLSKKSQKIELIIIFIIFL